MTILPATRIKVSLISVIIGVIDTSYVNATGDVMIVLLSVRTTSTAPVEPFINKTFMHHFIFINKQTKNNIMNIVQTGI